MRIAAPGPQHPWATSATAQHLAAELPAQRTMVKWQIALGEATARLPLMGPELFDPYQTGGLPLERIPMSVRQAWAAPFAPDAQVELAYRQHDFRVGPGKAVQGRVTDRWWTTPEWADLDNPPFFTRPCLKTTRGPWLGAPCVAAFGVEDSFFAPWPRGVEDMKWRSVDVPSTVRVYEIDGSVAWVRLVEHYPYLLAPRTRPAKPTSDLSGWFPGQAVYEPDWPAVAQNFDVVHLTQLAYLECAYAPIPCLGGVTTISGWGPDVAVWLTSPRASTRLQ